MEFLFWFSILIVFYTYFGYPLLLLMIKPNFKEDASDVDYVNWNVKFDFLVLAYNEEKVISNKIKNSLEILKKFKNAKLILVSDGSTDKTNNICETYTTHPQFIFSPLSRSGKAQSINKIVDLLEGEIIIFSDANVEYSENTLIHLLKPYADPNIGFTCGKVIYNNPEEVISGKGESFYWKYENFLKKQESKIGFIAGATGAVYSIRRSLFLPLKQNCINDDFTISMNVIKQGFKSKYVEEAIVYESVAPTIEAEFKRHIRDATGHYLSLIHLTSLLNPFLGRPSFVFWSHRALRWLVPLLLILIFSLNIYLLSLKFFLLLFYFQIAFYSFAIIAFIFRKIGKLPFILFIPFYFCNLNTALLIGLIRSLFIKQNGMWESTRR
jgi:biofilm PGA synthesis N-glycosyltransferase PgaC